LFRVVVVVVVGSVVDDVALLITFLQFFLLSSRKSQIASSQAQERNIIESLTQKATDSINEWMKEWMKSCSNSMFLVLSVKSLPNGARIVSAFSGTQTANSLKWNSFRSFSQILRNKHSAGTKQAINHAPEWP